MLSSSRWNDNVVNCRKQSGALHCYRLVVVGMKGVDASLDAGQRSEGQAGGGRTDTDKAIGYPVF